MRSRTSIGWLIGIIAAGVSVGIGEFVAAFVRPAASPLIAVGNRVITLTPQDAKNTAIQSAGQDDKLYLILGILLVLALLGALIGAAALRRLRNGLIGVGLIGAFGLYCALTADASRATDVIPTLVGTAAGMGALVLLVRIAAPPAVAKPTASTPLLADRRLFLQGGAATAALAAVAGFGGRDLQHRRFDVADERRKVRLPQAAAKETAPTGVDLGRSGVPWQTPNSSFYRIDRALTVPQISPQDWRLRIHGMVDKPMTLTYQQLLARPLVERWITMCCVSNEVGGDLISNAQFKGALLADLLREAGLHPDADQLYCTSDDGMSIGAPAKVVMDGRDSLLAVGMNGVPLPVEHGFPVRIVVPGLYGYVSACKWVVDIEATTFAKKQAYWVEGGWAAHPPLLISSRIDRPRSSGTVNVGETVAVAGVAWDQHVGVSKVEVCVDDGPWRPARLATVPSTDTWRQWVFPWTPQKSGMYRLTVRATDAKGTVQDDTPRDVFPSGATGLHSITVRAVV